MTRDDVRLTLPAVPDYASLARLAAGGLASRIGFTHDEVDQLRHAVAEVFAPLFVANGDERARVECVFMLTPNVIRLDGRRSNGGVPPAHPLEGLRVRGLVDEYGQSEDGTEAYVVKRRRPGN